MRLNREKELFGQDYFVRFDNGREGYFCAEPARSKAKREGSCLLSCPQRVEELHSGEKSCTAQGELEGAKPASNPIKCPAKPCCAGRAAREAGTFPLRSSGKVTAFLGCEKSDKTFSQPEGGRCAPALFLSLQDAKSFFFP